MEYIDTSYGDRIPVHKVDEVTSKPPFVQGIEGAFNIRALPFAAPRPHYRSGDLHKLTPEAVRRLRHDLNVTTCFDLRSENELQRRPFPTAIADEGIEVVHCPISSNVIAGNTNNTAVALQRHAAASSPEEAFLKDYANILATKGDLWIKLIFDLWAERPNDSFLINCSAGKDRTGTIAALMNLLAGVDHETICIDYALTRFGLECQADFLGPLLINTGVQAGLPQAEAEKAAISLSTSTADTMRGLIKVVEERYGGIERYLLDVAKLDPENLNILKSRLEGCEKSTYRLPAKPKI